jgi:hypothetical protein
MQVAIQLYREASVAIQACAQNHAPAKLTDRSRAVCCGLLVRLGKYRLAVDTLVTHQDSCTDVLMAINRGDVEVLDGRESQRRQLRPRAQHGAELGEPHMNRTDGDHRLRAVLVVAETALAVIVVTGAGLLMRTVQNLTAVDTGFDRARLATFSVALPPAR